jgi:hypothetical protein
MKYTHKYFTLSQGYQHYFNFYDIFTFVIFNINITGYKTHYHYLFIQLHTYLENSNLNVAMYKDFGFKFHSE